MRTGEETGEKDEEAIVGEDDAKAHRQLAAAMRLGSNWCQL